MKKLFLTLTMLLVVAVGSGLACSGWDCSNESGMGYVNGETGFQAQSGNGNVFVASDNYFEAYSAGDGYRYVHGSSYADAYGYGYDDYDFGLFFTEANSYGTAWTYSQADAGAHGYKGDKFSFASVSGLAHQNNFALANPFDFEGVTFAAGGNYSTAMYDGFNYRWGYYNDPHVYVSGGADVWGHTNVEAWDLGPIAGANTHTHSDAYAWLNGYGIVEVQGAGEVSHAALADNNEWGGTPGNWAFTGASAGYSFNNVGFCGSIYGTGQANTYGTASSFSTQNSVNVSAQTHADASVNSGSRPFWELND